MHGTMGSFSLVSSRNLDSGFQVMLRICLGFPVKISSHRSVVGFRRSRHGTIEPELRRCLEAETQEVFATKITTNERDDTIIKFCGQYI